MDSREIIVAFDGAEYRELRRKYGTGAIIMLTVDFLELSLMLASLKLSKEHSEARKKTPAWMLEDVPDYEKHIDRLRKRIIAATGQLGLSVEEIDLLKSKFM